MLHTSMLSCLDRFWKQLSWIHPQRGVSLVWGKPESTNPSGRSLEVASCERAGHHRFPILQPENILPYRSRSRLELGKRGVWTRCCWRPPTPRMCSSRITLECWVCGMSFKSSVFSRQCSQYTIHSTWRQQSWQTWQSSYAGVVQWRADNCWQP